MAEEVTYSDAPEGVGKTIPPDADTRARIRETAEELLRPVNRDHPLTRDQVWEFGRDVIIKTGYCSCMHGYTMVAANNAFWRDQFASVEPSRRILLLPHCLRDSGECKGRYTPDEFICAQCGACALGDLKQEAEALGYRVVVAEGSPAVVKLLLEESFEAVLGVACLDSLDKAFQKVVSLGVPHLASPLLLDNCVDTICDVNEIRELMALRSERGVVRARSYLPLMRKTANLFEPPVFDRLLGGFLESGSDGQPSPDPIAAVDALSEEWLREGGKRLRPFVVLAAYALASRGEEFLRQGEIDDDIFPDAVCRVAAAIEIFHKASLVHDDIEDDDPTRYGRETMHRRHGVSQALNAGDFLIGLGYQVVAAQSQALGAERVADILAALSNAQLRLCRGQGAEMVWDDSPPSDMTPLDALAVYSAKTAPAFEVALYAGLRLADCKIDIKLLRSFCRSLGVAYQIQDDLDEWDTHTLSRRASGFDALAGRATLLRVFALEATDEATCASLVAVPDDDEEAFLVRMGETYERLGVFAKARALRDKFRQRALAATDDVDDGIADLLRLLVDTLLGPS